ncbi:hypothetical protein ABGV42_00015 [Paenibacillus pabuli]|uniref:hypothetical protein n=1 Tax=Paenibacillus pabuli TaxID=1472 RepID=UPI0032429319
MNNTVNIDLNNSKIIQLDYDAALKILSHHVSGYTREDFVGMYFYESHPFYELIEGIYKAELGPIPLSLYAEHGTFQISYSQEGYDIHYFHFIPVI